MIEKILERLEEYEYSHLIERDSEETMHCKSIDCNGGGSCLLCVMEKAKAIVQEVAKEYGNGWIPCSERLPELKQEVLITADDYAVYQCVMINGGFHVWEAGWIDKKRVLAWMELPAPYQKGE